MLKKFLKYTLLQSTKSQEVSGYLFYLKNWAIARRKKCGSFLLQSHITTNFKEICAFVCVCMYMRMLMRVSLGTKKGAHGHTHRPSPSRPSPPAPRPTRRRACDSRTACSACRRGRGRCGCVAVTPSALHPPAPHNPPLAPPRPRVPGASAVAPVRGGGQER